MDEKNYAEDFVNAVQGQKPTARRGLPPLHPRENDRWVNLAAEDTEMEPAVANSPNLLDLPKQKISVHYRQFQLNDPAQVAELEQIVNHCVSKRGWILAREEWDLDTKGNKIVTLKYLEVEKIKKRAAKEKEEAGVEKIPATPAFGDDEVI